MAQVTIRNMFELECVSERDANTPLLSAIDEIKKPISPRAVIAQPTMDAGYSDFGMVMALSDG